MTYTYKNRQQKSQYPEPGIQTGVTDGLQTFGQNSVHTASHHSAGGGGMMPLSSAGAAPASGPIQAGKNDENKQPQYEPFFNPPNLDVSKAGKVNQERELGLFLNERKNDRSLALRRPGTEDMSQRMEDNVRNLGIAPDTKLSNPHTGLFISGLGLGRLRSNLVGETGAGMSNEEIEKMYGDLLAPHDSSQPYTEETDERFNQAVYTLKEAYYRQLKRLEATYGTLGTQMHPEDFLRQIDTSYMDHMAMIQDTQQMIADDQNPDRKGKRYFDFENNEKDREFKRLNDYFFNMNASLQAYMTSQVPGMDAFFEQVTKPEMEKNDAAAAPEVEAAMQGPHMSRRQKRKYMRDLRKRAAADEAAKRAEAQSSGQEKRSSLKDRLFGRFAS